MKKTVRIALTILFLIGCASTQKGHYDEYDNSIRLGNNTIQVDKEFKYLGDLHTDQNSETMDGVLTGTIKHEEYLFIHLNLNNEIDKGIIVYSGTLKDPQHYWRSEMDFSNDKNYKSHMHIGRVDINNINCTCVVKKWPSVGKRYSDYAKAKGYKFDMSKACLIESKIGKTLGRSRIITVSYIEGLDSCKNVRNIEGENSEIVQEMLSQLKSNVNIK